MKLYSLLILDKKQKSQKTILKHRKRVKYKTSQKYRALYTTYSHVLDGEIKAIAANWCLVDRTWGDTPATLIVCSTLGRRHHHVAQCCKNIRRPLASVYVYKKLLSGFIEMLIKNI